jgi:PIN domain nuclease of toxin-antitoxin system
MKYLLDTHTFLWILRAPEHLSPTVHRIVQDHRASIFLSIATPWEMAIKASLGKLDVADLLDGFDRLLADNGYLLLETKAAHVIRAGMLPLYHRDPFDRLLAAQALELDLPILSRDLIFDRYGLRRLWE